MNQDRIKTLRKALEPLREAVDILGDALVGAKDNREEINDAFTSTDFAIEYIEIVAGLSRRSKPRPFGEDMVTAEIFKKKVELGETLPAESVEFVRTYEAAMLALKGRAKEEHAARRPAGFKGLPAEQRMSALRNALRLMRKGKIILDAAYDAEKEAINHIVEDMPEEGTTALDPFYRIWNACDALEDAIETVKILAGLPQSQLIVLENKVSAVCETIREQRDRVDAGIPEVLRLKEEQDRLKANFLPEMQALMDAQSLSLYEAIERTRAEDKYVEAQRLGETLDQIRKTDDRYAEVQRLCAERDSLWEEIDRISGSPEAVRRGDFMVISSAGA